MIDPSFARRHPSLVGSRALPCAALLAAGLLASQPAVGGEVSVQPGVVFGSTCARCHEGECSGRLTFDLGAEGAAGHVRRHAGPLSDVAVQELFTLLERMKKECAYPPLKAPVPQDGGWSPQLLARLCIPSRRSYFVPLGKLEPGRYALELRFDGAPHVHVEVVTRRFDILLDEPLAVERGKATAAFQVSASDDAYLRLRAQEPISARRLKLERR